MVDSCLEQPMEAIEPWFLNISGLFWTKLGLGFQRGREKNGEEERKRENWIEKVKEIRVKTFYTRRGTGWVLTRSSAPRSKPLDLGPDGSGSVQRFWSILEIRIHHPRGFRPGSLGFFSFFSVSWVSLLRAPRFLLFGPSVHFEFLTKMPKNYYAFLMCF